MDRRRSATNGTYKKLAVQCSADTFVVNQGLVLRIKMLGEYLDKTKLLIERPWLLFSPWSQIVVDQFDNVLEHAGHFPKASGTGPSRA